MLIKGNGMPTTGIIPMTIARLIKTVEINIKLSPPIVNLQNLSLALSAKYKHLNIIKKLSIALGLRLRPRLQQINTFLF